MEHFYTLVAGALLTAVLVLTVRRHNGEVAMLLCLCGCILLLVGMAQFLRPVLQFVARIQSIAGLGQEITQILWKITGVSVLSQIATLICNDAGNAALGKCLQILTTVVILWLALPLLEALLSLAERILVNL